MEKFFNNLVDNKIPINLSQLRQGFYFIKIENNKYSYLRKFIKL
jgi:hypothetical protein